jgi:mitogen-activated protein kinase kinase kinase
MKTRGPFQETLISSYAKQILEGLKYLHDQRIIHKDIKAANILINDSNIVKLADFGSAQQLERTLTISLRPGNKNLSIYGSIPWMAPEVIRQTKYGRKADIWSFGCTILEIAQGKAPWSEYNFDNPIAAIMKIGLSDEIPKMPDNLSINLKNFIQCCLKRDANQRPHAKELLNHPFLLETL